MSTTASTIQGRMLCAAGLAYALPHASKGIAVGPMPQSQLTAPFYAGAGYAAAPTSIQNGLAACTVGSNSDGIVIAFRGTEFDSAFNWLDNAEMEYTTQAGIPGFIHHGFNGYVNNIIAEVAQAVKTLLAADSSAKVFITGHSAGAGMAPIAAYHLAESYGIAATALYLMAPPSPGDKTFADAYNLKFPDSFSYENGEDIVPVLPLSAPNALLFLAQAKSEFLRHVLEVMIGLDYHRVGSDDNIYLLNFPKKGDQKQMHLFEDLTQWGLVETILLAGNFADKEIGSTAGLFAALFLDFDRFATAHSHGCGHGYMNALCPEISCP
jgi:Lipase (class 3)